MGLDFSHCDAYWSYSGFNRFRERLANQIGFSLGEMVGFGGKREWDTVHDDIKPLLDHSDCDGVLTPEECKIVYPRLAELIQNWSEYDRDKIMALELIEGMKLCVELDEDLEFL
jgi:hypothetical protein